MAENQCQCVVPLAEIVGTMTAEQAEQWARSERVELRSTWNGRTAISADDAKLVYERAAAAAETARLRNQAKTVELLTAFQAAIPKGKPLPDGLKGVDALSLMKADERDERLEKLDELYEEYASGYAVYHPIRDEG